MTRPEALYQWEADVREHLPQLSPAMARVLAWWSYGVAMTERCGTPSIALFLALVLGVLPNTMRQRLREFYQEAKVKRGSQRRQVTVATHLPDLLRWALAGRTGPRVALAMDATTLKDRWVVRSVAVVVRRTAIPVHWTVLPAGAAGAWRPHWERMLDELSPGMPADAEVLVLADRGLYAKWLYRRIVQHGWHPFLRVNGGEHGGGTFRVGGRGRFWPMARHVPRVGTAWVGEGEAFANAEGRLRCTLVARWDAGYKDPWLVLTDLAPGVVDAAWYGLRSWIEQSYRLSKRGGLRWHQTRMTEPGRVERHWLVLAVALLRMIHVGSAHEAADEGPDGKLSWTLSLGLGVARRGWLWLLAAALRHDPLPTGAYLPQPWPTSFPQSPSHYLPP